MTRKTLGINDIINSKILKPSINSIYSVNFTIKQEVKTFLNNRYGNRVNLGTIPEDLEILCIGASLPGSTLMTHEATNDFTGVTERHAYRRLYDDRADFTFLVDVDYTPIFIFEGWMNYIASEGDLNSTKDLKTTGVSYRFKFPNKYKTNFEIIKYEKDVPVSENRELKYTFVDGFPIAANSIPVSYGGSDFLSYTVSFSYVRYVHQLQVLPRTNSPRKEKAPDRVTFGERPLEFLDLLKANPDIA